MLEYLLDNLPTILVAMGILFVLIIYAKAMIFVKKPKSLCVGSDGGACRFCEHCPVEEQARKDLQKRGKHDANS